MTRILFIILLVGGFLVAALPSVIVMIVGMIPTLVAYIIDLTPKRYAARCVCGLNVAGTMPFLDKLWSSANDLPAAVAIVTDVFSWLAFYLTAGIGWLLFLGLPSLVAQFKSFAARRKAQSLRQRLQALEKEWGPDVAGKAASEARDPGTGEPDESDPLVAVQTGIS